MKKIIRGVLLGLLAVIIIGGAIVAYMLFGGKKPEISPQPYVVDEQGMTYLAVVNEEGVTYAAVTDAVGNIYAAEINDDGSIGETKGLINDQVDPSKLPSNYTGARIDDTADVNAFTGSASEEIDVTVPTTAVTPGTTGSQNGGQSTSDKQGGSDNTATTKTQSQPTTAAQQHFRLEKYQEMFEKGQYLIEFKTSDPELGDTPITFATKNGNAIIDTSIQNYTCKMLYLANQNKTYLLIDDFKKYCELSEDLMGGESLDMSSMMSGIAGETDGLTATTVKINGQTLNCESRTNEDGSQTKYYFNGDTLVRIDTVNVDGTSESTYISRITSDVPDSMFEIPKNYGYLNISWLEKLAG